MGNAGMHHAVAGRSSKSVKLLRPLRHRGMQSLGSAVALASIIAISTLTLANLLTTVYAQDSGCLLLSEIMILPHGEHPEQGQWIEIVNVCEDAVNLSGWSLVTEIGYHVVSGDLSVEPGAFIVLGSHEKLSQSQNVSVAYIFSKLRLTQQYGTLSLAMPDGTVADLVEWSTQNNSAPPADHSLERTGTSQKSAWRVAEAMWPGSNGNYGSPGRAYYDSPPVEAPTEAPFATTEAPLATTEAVITPDNPPATATPPPRVVPAIYISEILADPAAVADDQGEWLELYSGESVPVNLNGWLLRDDDNDAHRIESDLWIQPGEYIVLGRNTEVSSNGGVAVRYAYTSLTLANESDELCLYSPWGALADRLVWGDDSPYRIKSGASLERTGFDARGTWTTAQTQWPGSLGDRGSPGTAYTPAPTPTPEPVLPNAWSIGSATSPLVIEEVLADGQEDEFVVLLNRSDMQVDLTGWSVGDAETPGDGEGIYRLPSGYLLAPGQLFIIARNANSFASRWGFASHAEFEESDGSVTTLERISSLASGTFALNNSGDEVILWNPSMEIADAIAYGNSDPWDLQLTGRLPSLQNESYQCDNSVDWRYSDDLRHRYSYSAPNPGVVRALPAPTVREHPGLNDGLVALWGSLGTQSNFTSGGNRSPHVLSADAAADGYDFLAITDGGMLHTRDSVRPNSQIVILPAWQWPTGSDALAIVYADQQSQLSNWSDLRTWLQSTHTVAQARTIEPPAFGELAACSADALHANDYRSLLRAWQSNRRPMLPAGNATPGKDGYAGQLYTGLGVRSVDNAGVMEAIANRRGWATSSLDTWLTLRSDNGEWMGAASDRCGERTYHVHYGDRNQDAAGLTLWRNDEPVQQLDTAASGQTWTATIYVKPGDFVYASATQFDGDFAVTSPILISYSATGCETEANSLAPPQTSINVNDLDDDDDERVRDAIAVAVEQGQEDGPYGTVARAKLMGLEQFVEFRAQVTAPPGLFNSAIYVAEPAAAQQTIAGLGMQVYLLSGDFTPMEEGDWVLVKGELHSFHGEMELLADDPGQVWRIGEGKPILPLSVSAADVGESLEGRLVTFIGEVTGWRGDSFYICDPHFPDAEVQVTVRSSLDWKRPYVNPGEVWQITGIVSQFAKEHPWNGGYRVLARYKSDLVRVE